MARLWQDDYWLLLLQLYLKAPQGVKPLYSHALIDVALRTHLKPQYIYRKLFRLRRIDTPLLQELWNRYAEKPTRLKAVVKKLQMMDGFGNAEEFYDGVEATREWERDFKPVSAEEAARGKDAVTPVKLIAILNLYYQLVPATMVADTPEVAALAKQLHMSAKEVADIMTVYQACDPFLSEDEGCKSPLYEPCRIIWRRFGNDDPEKLAALAAQLTDYWK